MNGDKTPLALSSQHAGLVRRGTARRFTLASLATLVSSCVLALTANSAPSWLINFVPHALGLSVVLMPALLVAAGLTSLLTRPGAQGPATLTLEGDALVLTRPNGAKKRYPLSEFTEGLYSPLARRVALRRRDGNELAMSLPEDEAAELLAATRMDASSRTLTVPLRGMLGNFTRGLLGFMGSYIVAVFGAALVAPRHMDVNVMVCFALAVLGSAATVKYWGSPRLVIGADGLTVLSGLSKRFVSYADVAEVVHDPGAIVAGDAAGVGHYGGLRVTMRDGRILMLPVIGQSTEQLEITLGRIHLARAHALANAGSRAAAMELLDRNGRGLKQWIAEVRALVNGAAFRAASLTREDLRALVRNATAPAARRVAAALALLEEKDDPEAREEVRVAADASAEPRVRVALEKTLDGTLDQATVAALPAERAAQGRVA